MAFELSRRAVEDLYHIYRTGVEDFGVDQAERYQDGLEETFVFLEQFPQAARIRTELRGDVRAHPYRSHLIFYRIDGENVFILRIRHAREDWSNEPGKL